MKLTALEKEAKAYYDRLWSDPNRIRKITQEIPSWHFGFYEEGIDNLKEAKNNMMEYVGRLLDLDSESPMNILDAGSGVGSTSIYLGKKYSNCLFHGITISHFESLIAGIIQKKKQINNVRFQLGSYMNTSYLDNSFDRIFALESVIYSPDKKEFVKEMYRILKPEGKIVVLDIFPKRYQYNSLTIKIDNYLYNRRNPKDSSNNYYTDIDKFIRLLKSKKFGGIKKHNLIKLGNIKKQELYKSLILSSFVLLITRLRTIDTKRSFKNKFLSPFVIFIFVVYKLLLGFYSNEYYSIEAIKH
jgi:ubiquinone/menaquinone biosynthesis C-methylase UbiE